MLTESRAIRVTLELAKHSGFRDRIVGPALQQRGDPAFQDVDAVACDQQKPVRGPPLAEGVGVTSDDSRQASQRLCRTEASCGSPREGQHNAQHGDRGKRSAAYHGRGLFNLEPVGGRHRQCARRSAASVLTRAERVINCCSS